MTARRSRLRPAPRRGIRLRRQRRPLIEADLDDDEEVDIGGGEPDRDAGPSANLT
jgi:hypothetical protein